MAFMDMKLIKPKLFYVLQEVPKKKDTYKLLATFAIAKDAEKAAVRTKGTVYLGALILKTKTKYKILQP